MKTKSEIINEISKIQAVRNTLIMEIGQGYANVRLYDDSRLVTIVNQKIEAYSQTEAELQILENLLANFKE
jgi:hypothetical protein